MEQLDKLLDLAGHHAHAVMLGLKQSLLPAWLLLDGHGQSIIIGTPWENDEQKARAVARMRREMQKRHTVAYSFLCEAWAATQPKEWKLDDPILVRPKDRPDRREVVVALACTRDQTRMRQWAIVRDYNEQVTQLQLDEKLPPDGYFDSWMADLLK